MYCRTARLTVSNRADAHSSVAAAVSDVFVKQLRLESSSSQQGVEQIEQRWSGRGKILLLATLGHHVSMFCKLWVKFIVDLHQFTQLILVLILFNRCLLQLHHLDRQDQALLVPTARQNNAKRLDFYLLALGRKSIGEPGRAGKLRHPDHGDECRESRAASISAPDYVKTLKRGKLNV
jgi:hypothetical protein